MDANGGMAAFERNLNLGQVERFQTGQGVESVDDQGRLIVFMDLSFQEGGDGFVLAFDQQPACGLPSPIERTVDTVRQLLRREFTQGCPRGRRGVPVRQDPDPAMIPAIDEAVLLLKVPGNGRVIFDDLPVKIHNRNRAIWRMG